MNYAAKIQTPMGNVLLASDGKNLIGLWFAGQKYYGESMDSSIEYKDGLPVFIQTKKWLERYFAGEMPAASELPLAPAGSEFRKAVWEALCQIPYGEVITYGELAQKVAMLHNRERMSAQAVGGAVGHNAISIIIPCHRVVGANGNLTGYAGGIDKKIKLLTHEGAYSKSFFVPKKSTAP